jgi:putative DNA primase/helicase
MLRGSMMDLAEKLLGPRHKALSTRTDWRFGSKGALSICVQGTNRGRCVNFESGWKGDPWGLIETTLHLDSRGAVLWAASYFGISAEAPPPEDPEVQRQREADRAAKQAETERREAHERKARISRARWHWAQRSPLTGTVGAIYLASRGLTLPSTGWPDSVAFLRANKVTVAETEYSTAGAVMVCATDAAGAVCAVQRIYLDANGGNLRDAAGNKIKLTSGSLRETGAVVRLPGAADGQLLLAEGPETGLSVWLATGYETHIALGGMAHHQPPAGRRHVAACRDDDPEQSPADKAFARAAAAWVDTGLDVAVATPWPTRRHDKTDFNDTLQHGGISAVLAQIEAALPPQEAPRRRRSIEEGRTVLWDAVAKITTLEKWTDDVEAAERRHQAAGTASANWPAEIIDLRKARTVMQAAAASVRAATARDVAAARVRELRTIVTSMDTS